MDFYEIFLDYFKKCVQERVQINIDEMLEIAKGNENSANSALQELINNGIVTFKSKMNVFQPETRLENFENITLTEKGINKILKMFPEGEKEIFADIISDTKSKNINSIEINSIHEKLLQQIRRDSEFKSKNANTTKIKKYLMK